MLDQGLGELLEPGLADGHPAGMVLMLAAAGAYRASGTG